MKHLLLISSLMLGACAAMAQAPLSRGGTTPQTAVQRPPTQQIVVADSTSVPQMTVVPVQQTAVEITEHTVVDEARLRDMTREERRAYKARVFAQRIDSLVESRNYVFWPASMQEAPNGTIRSIYADYFYFGMFADHVEVHLPTERGLSQYVEVLNFDSMNIRNYRASRTQSGWNVEFQIVEGDKCYVAELLVSDVTGETILNLLAPTVAMRYVGSILGPGRHFHPIR